MLPLCYQSIYPSSSSSHHRHVVATVTSWCHLHVGCGFVIAIVVLPSSSHHCRVVVAVMSLQCLLLRIRTASHAYREYLQTDYDTGSVQNGPGLSRDNPLCLLFILPYSLFAFQRFQTHVLYKDIKRLMGALLKRSRLVNSTWRYQWLMGALLKRSRPVNSTWRRSPFYVQYRRRSLHCVLYIARHIGHSSIKG